MSAALTGKVAIVTGAGRGIGRAEAMFLAAHGAIVVVNDLGVAWDGTESAERPAELVCKEIESTGGTAVPDFSDISTEDGAEALLELCLRRFGDVDILINNAGILRDGMLFSISPADWKAVIDVHLMGHFLTTRVCGRYWREQSKAGVQDRPRTIVNTSSESGLFGNAAQTNYDVAKLGIASLTMATAKELANYGVTCNAIAPRARTRMTAGTFSGSARGGEFAAAAEGFDAMDPANIAPFVGFLATDSAREITGQVFIVYGAAVARVRLPHVDTVISNDGRTWSLDELASRVPELFTNRGPGHFEGPRGYARLPKQ